MIVFYTPVHSHRGHNIIKLYIISIIYYYINTAAMAYTHYLFSFFFPRRRQFFDNKWINNNLNINHCVYRPQNILHKSHESYEFHIFVSINIIINRIGIVDGSIKTLLRTNVLNDCRDIIHLITIKMRNKLPPITS